MAKVADELLVIEAKPNQEEIDTFETMNEGILYDDVNIKIRLVDTVKIMTASEN